MFGLFTCVFASIFVCIDIGFPVCLPSSSPDNVLLDMLPCVCIYLLALRILSAFNLIHLHLCKPISSIVVSLLVCLHVCLLHCTCSFGCVLQTYFFPFLSACHQLACVLVLKPILASSLVCLSACFFNCILSESRPCVFYLMNAKMSVRML